QLFLNPTLLLAQLFLKPPCLLALLFWKPPCLLAQLVWKPPFYPQQSNPAFPPQPPCPQFFYLSSSSVFAKKEKENDKRWYQKPPFYHQQGPPFLPLTS
ncbi:hypothetical protein VIGAN_02077800, partial [Vigna angularis var. angularis]